MNENYLPVRFSGESIQVSFDKPPAKTKSPPCPDHFTWNDQVYRVAAILKQWFDFSRRGRFRNNMQPHNQRKAIRRGSWGVGRFYFRVRTSSDHIFELYYDREPSDVDDRYGTWILYRELMPAPDID